MANDDTPEEPPVEIEAEVVEEDHDNEGEEHVSGLASKALTGIALLLIGGGLALWSGPKIAPNLPSGMAPVATWLAPGGDQATAEVAALKAEIENRFAALPEPVSKESVDAAVSGAIAGVTTDFASKVDALSAQISASDSGDIESRLAALEAKTDGLQAELGNLINQLGEISAAGGEVSSETSAQIATYGALIEGLKAEIHRLAAQNGSLSQKIDEVAASTEQQVAEADNKANAAAQTAEVQRKAATIRAALDKIGLALTSGASFEDALASLKNEGVTLPQGLASAAKGVPTLAQLRSDFPMAANEAIRADIAATKGGNMFAAFGSFLKSQVATRSLTPQDGNSVDAVLSRAEAALKADDLSAALAELDALSEDARAPMEGWIADARSRLNAENAYAALSGALQSE